MAGNDSRVARACSGRVEKPGSGRQRSRKQEGPTRTRAVATRTSRIARGLASGMGVGKRRPCLVSSSAFGRSRISGYGTDFSRTGATICDEI